MKYIFRGVVVFEYKSFIKGANWLKEQILNQKQITMKKNTYREMEYDIKEVRQKLIDAGYVMISSHETQSGIIKGYEYWFNNKLDQGFSIEVLKNNAANIFKQMTINAIE